ncbi:11110_t:CDS:2 [Gigaspora rosea]|nr:11110_t:CDS:2 [Gigaspora rosea]
MDLHISDSIESSEHGFIGTNHQKWSQSFVPGSNTIHKKNEHTIPSVPQTIQKLKNKIGEKSRDLLVIKIPVF